MGTMTVTGAIVVLTAWFALVEFDRFPEAERHRILAKIKETPLYITVIALMPVGIVLHMIGGIFELVSLLLIGATLIFLQGIIVSLYFWKWHGLKGIILLTAIVLLGIFIYLPLFIS